jgi:hypothetical protein
MKSGTQLEKTYCRPIEVAAVIELILDGPDDRQRTHRVADMFPGKSDGQSVVNRRVRRTILSCAKKSHRASAPVKIDS